MCAVSGPVLRRRMAGRYPVSPGVALIISVRDFKGKDEPRLGARNDFMFLKSTFTVTGCRTFPATEKLNWSQSDFVNALKEAVTPFEEEEAFKRGPFFLCFSTHGDEKGITLSDGEYLPLNVLRAILAEQETLRSRPKVIVIQACRGAMCMTKDGPKLSSFKVTADSAADPWGNTMGIASCVQTRVSYSSDLGSIFILHFCNEILRGLLDNDGCTIQDVKEGVVRALTGIRKFNSQEIVYTTPELFCDNLQGALVLKPTNRDAVQKWRAIVTHFLSKMPWEIERNEEDIKISGLAMAMSGERRRCWAFQPSPWHIHIEAATIAFLSAYAFLFDAAFPLDEPTHEVTTAEMVDAGKFEEQSSMVSVLEEPSPCVAAGADSALDVNGFVDQLLSAARAEISNRGMEQVSLPDISEKLKQKVISIKIPGRFLAFNGWAKSLASLHRIGDAVMSTNGDKLSLDIPLSLTDLQIR
ncbi:uncharacterized protein LOC117639242 isoform X1 [Thrips palmi]|uniref:Uncharacterized protein LOC117639242 isoform X1 n=1 Tax=Thrips palmi TaxID=161013 RepID=A0A6P8YA49_THRPL|nr:uncharacterized protein LOC117639242 isoform X1 [Thrips palmi]